MWLSSLLNSWTPVAVHSDREISGLALDSRDVKPGYLFCAFAGSKNNGLEYIDEARRQGAVAVLMDANERFQIPAQASFPFLCVPNLKAVLGSIASRFYGHPSEKLRVYGVTGTNGKTSCTHFIAQILHHLGMSCGVVGTLGQGIWGQGALVDFGLTTPDAISLQKHLRHFVTQGAGFAALEVSSHSIDQARVQGVQFDVGVFTNLTQDHLDYHGSMAAYAATKKRFLQEYPVKHLVINADDPYGAAWLKEGRWPTPSVVAYSMAQAVVPQLSEMVRLMSVTRDAEGAEIEINTPWGGGRAKVPVVGDFNISNVLAVISALGVAGWSLSSILQQISRLTPVPGRLEKVPDPLGYRRVVVDYAHTPDALKQALLALRPYVTGQLICVFGCGGDRDQHKRPIMAKVAEAYADRVLVTSDNPRHESAEQIVEQIVTGFSQPNRVEVVLDRSKAIQKSIQWARDGDCVLIAGKGAERYQQIGDLRLPFSDVEEASRYLFMSFV